MKERRYLLILPCAMFLLMVWLLTQDALSGWEGAAYLSASRQHRMQKEILAAASLCYQAGDVDTIENILIDAGFSTVDSDEIYPSYLANPGSVYAFWDEVSAEKDANLTVYRVNADGSLRHLYFQWEDGEGLFFSTDIGWEDHGKPYVLSSEVLPIYDMELSEWDIFYYRLYPAGDPHYIDYNQLRLTPADRDAYDLNRKYILPVGYQMVNLFLQDWQEGSWGGLSFHDLLEALYAMQTGENLGWEPYLSNTAPTRARIPAQIFEGAILPYFQIALEEFRTLCAYDAQTGTYPWRPIHGDNLTTWNYPMCEPEVVDWTQNSDGTLTLTVQVYSPELKTDRLFIHELTVRPLESGGFQYVANQVTYVSDRGLPPNMPRFELDAT